MKKSALFVDFDDSFSFNVIQKLDEAGFSVKKIHWTDFGFNSEEDLLVLGPGPGHPDEYEKIFPQIKNYLKLDRPFFGICLGHQIYWHLQGAQIVRSHHPCHGQKCELILDPDWQRELDLPAQVWVQRYNSLCVPEEAAALDEQGRSMIQAGEILITRRNKILTYQFHPESEGTSFPQSFFLPLIRDLV